METLENFGEPIFVSSPKRRNKIIRYPSRVLPDVVFEFSFTGKYKSTEYYRCISCKALYRQRKRKESNPDYGALIHVTDGIIVSNPDSPAKAHTCLSTPIKRTVANTLVRRYLADARREANKTRKVSLLPCEAVMNKVPIGLKNSDEYLIKNGMKECASKIKSPSPFSSMESPTPMKVPDEACLHKMHDISDSSKHKLGQDLLKSHKEDAERLCKISEQSLVFDHFERSFKKMNCTGKEQFGDFEEAPEHPQSNDEAMKWCKRGGEQENAEVQNKLGDLHSREQSVPNLMEEAVKWYRGAAEEGNAEAQSKLGDMYFWGQGVPRSIDEAVKWYRKAAQQGYKFPYKKLVTNHY